MLSIAFLSCGKDSNLVDGEVLDTKGNPIENVLVQVMGTDLNSKTNAEGVFRINTRNRGDELIFTHPDYKMARLQIQEDSDISIQLTRKNTQAIEK